MEETTYKITLADGTELSDLRLNGNNFISSKKIEESIFNGNLSEVTILGDGKEETYENMELVQLERYGKEYWFILRVIPEAELVAAKDHANIEYLAMMLDIDLEEV